MRNEVGKATLLEELKDVPDLDTRLEVLVLGDYATSEGTAQLADAVKASHPEINHVVSCFGGNFKMGTASTLSPEDLHEALNRAIPHLLLGKALFPLLKADPSSSFTFITGFLGEKCVMPGVAALSIANAAIYGIIRSLEGEYAAAPQRINELRIAALIRRDSQPGHPFVKEGTAYPASLIGDVAVQVAEGQQKAEIIRIFPNDLAAKETAR